MHRLTTPGAFLRDGRAYWLAAVAVIAWLSPALAEEASKTYRRYRGQIVFQSEAFGDYDTDQAFGAAVRKARSNKSLARDKDGNWTTHFVAFLKAAAGDKKVNLVWYRLGKKREQIDYTEFFVQPDAKTLKAQTKLISAVGFKPGDKLEARITRLINGREKVYARMRITLR